MSKLEAFNQAAIDIGAALDHIERHEDDMTSVAGCLSTILKGHGYTEEEARAGSLQACQSLGNIFFGAYAANGMQSRIATILATLETAAEIIESGKIDEHILQAVRQASGEDGTD